MRGGLVYFDELLAAGAAARRDQCDARQPRPVGRHSRRARTGSPATIVVPHGNSLEKNAAMRALGVELIEHGSDFQASREHAARLANERGLHMIPSFHPLLVRGVASYALELLRGVPDLATVYVPIGLGSGISGMIAAREALGHKSRNRRRGVGAAPAYKLSFVQEAPSSTPSRTCSPTAWLPHAGAAALEIIWRRVKRW